MISKLSILIILLFFSIRSQCQFFEGKITYETIYKSKIHSLPDQFFNSLGSTHELFIKGGNYKYLYDSSLIEWQLYIYDKNRIYNKMINSPTIYWESGKDNDDKIIKSEINSKVTEIMGLVCDELKLTCRNGIYRYYFNTAYKINSKEYENHQAGLLAKVYSLINSLPLKIISENEYLYTESIAIEVKEMILNDSIFTIPKGSTVKKKKNPF
jgi:hypothetical protein